MSEIELYKSDEGKFWFKLNLDAGRAGTVEFMSIYPVKMSQSEAESRFIRLVEKYGFDHAPFHCIEQNRP